MANGTPRAGITVGSRQYDGRVHSLRVLVAADDATLVHAARARLAADPRVVVAETSIDFDDAGTLTRRLGPRVVVLATASRDSAVATPIRAARDASATTAVVLVAQRTDEPWVRMMLEAGARGYVSPDDPDLGRAVRAVASGGAYFSPDVANVVRRGYLRRGGLSVHALLDRLTAPEREVLRALVDGRTPSEIGARLQLSGPALDACRRRIVASLA